MSDVPEIEVTAGSPTPAQEQAARDAILQLWREDVATAVAAAGMSPWAAAGRLEATGRAAGTLRGRTAGAWRLAGRLSEPTSPISIGRGDAR